MEDDIDIEEHDVMDNPKIKSIFPDLSCVKMEVPDEEELEHQLQYDEPTHYQPQEILYQNEYTFGTAVENVTEDIEEESTEYDHVDGDIGYFYNNEIILGSKPPIDETVLYEEALYSQTKVFLEDWKNRLQNSPCYCGTCQILFPTVNALDAHKMISHSYLIALETPRENTARKSTVTSKYCNHCSKTFPDDTSLIKHLYELLPLNDFGNVKEDKIPEPISQKEPQYMCQKEPQFMCQKCKKTFVTYSAGHKHRKNKHPTLIHDNLITRIQRNKVEDKEIEFKPKEPKEVKIEPKMIKIEPKKIKLDTKDEVKTKKIKVDPKETKIELKDEVKPKKIKVDPKETKIELKDKDTNIQLKRKRVKKKNGEFFEIASLVPSRTLFQCNVCQVGFLSCYSAMQHSKTCEKVLNSEKCNICKRKIRNYDVKIHKLQHNYTDKLKIYTINRNIYERVLCKCPKCTACFDEIGFWAHYKKCNKREKKTFCSICDVNIASKCYERHQTRHLTKKLTKKDFIIIEFHDKNAVMETKSKITQNQMDLIRIKRHKEQLKKYRLGTGKCDDQITLFYCEFCSCCQGILQFNGHSNGSCIKNKKPYKQYCGKCGLAFSPRTMITHKNLHEKRQFTLKDIKIVNLTTDKQIDPPMPELFKCEKCEKHFLSQKLLHKHNCKTEKHVTCKICSIKLNLQAYKIHKMFHSVDKLIPELLKKYNSITNMWNVIYMCSACDLVTMTYDSAVTHSQGHLNYVISDLNKYCAVCDLNIAEKEFSNHEILHTNNEDIERGSFRILKYNHEDLFMKEWMSLFRPLPKQHRNQILSKSIYRFTRSVKMQVEVSGAPTDDIKYFCMNCKRFVDGPNIVQHIKTKCTRKNKYVCEICHEIFKSLKSFITHEGSHEKVPKRYTIATFNNECDQEFNNHLSLIESKAKNVINEPVEAPNAKLRELLNEGAKKSFLIYKCTKCQTCVTLRKSARQHCCAGKKNVKKKICKICEQYFNCKSYPLHMQAHRNKPAVNKNNLSIVLFNGAAVNKLEIVKPNDFEFKAKNDINETVEAPNSKLEESLNEEAKKSLQIYKCTKCQTCVTLRSSARRHCCVGKRTAIIKKYCKICEQYFNSKKYSLHMQAHRKKPAVNKNNVSIVLFNGAAVNKFGIVKPNNYESKAKNVINETVEAPNSKLRESLNEEAKKSIQIYKCTKCQMCVTLRKSARRHCCVGKRTIKKYYCKICEQYFCCKSYPLHMQAHRNKPGVNKNNLSIVLFNGAAVNKFEIVKPNNFESEAKNVIKETVEAPNSKLKELLNVGAKKSFQIYKCTKCQMCVTLRNSARRHCCVGKRALKQIYCKICEQYFYSKTYPSHIQAHRSNPAINKNNLSIVLFNGTAVNKFEIVKPNNFESEAKNVINETVEPPNSKLRELLNEGAKKSFQIYKCTKCQMCVTLKSSAQRHCCGVGKRIVMKNYCKICEQYFYYKTYQSHIQAHRSNPAINKNNLSIVLFNGAAVNKFEIVKPNNFESKAKNVINETVEVVKQKKDFYPELVAKVFKCECGLHFTSMRTIQNHLDVCSPNLEVFKETCSKCNLVFSTDVLVTHLINHHSKEMKILVENVEKVVLYKCPHCIIFFVGLDYYNNHIHNCDPINGQECSECQLIFDKKCFAKHKCSSQDTTYITKIITMKRHLKYTVYKCEQCDITYLSNKALKYHTVEVNHVNKLALITCQYCKLRFTKYSHTNHIKMHSYRNEDYQIKVINSVQGNSVMITGNNGDKDNEDSDSIRASPRKRKSDTKLAEIKPKRSFTANNLSDRRSKRLNKTIEQPSTSKSVDYNSENETEVTDFTPKKHKNKNVDTETHVNESSDSDSDIFDNSEIPKNTNNSADTSNIVSNRLKARILIHKYSNELYRCKYCDQHYMRDSSFDYHIKTYNHTEKTENFRCDICDLDFSRYTLPRHKYVHHHSMGLKREDFVILTETVYTKDSFVKIDKTLNGDGRTDVNMEFVDLEESVVESVIIDNSTENNSVNTKLDKEIEEKSDISETNSDIAEDVSDTTRNVSDSDKICYYKCSECNVCYINQKMCSEHIVEHKILDPKTYIQCKLCNFQFLIDSLKEHLEIHHSNDFKVENLTIHEYKGFENGSEPEIDIYKAVDKLQSRLVSTTTEIGIV